MVERIKKVSCQQIQKEEPLTRAWLAKRLREPTTWAGVFGVISAVASGGLTMLHDSGAMLQAASGLALVFAKEP